MRVSESTSGSMFLWYVCVYMYVCYMHMCMHMWVRICESVYACLCVYTRTCVQVCGGQKRHGSSEVHGLEGGCSELPTMWVLRTKLESSTRTVTDSSEPFQTRVRYTEYQAAQKAELSTGHRRQLKLPVLLSLLPFFNISPLYFCLWHRVPHGGMTRNSLRIYAWQSSRDWVNYKHQASWHQCWDRTQRFCAYLLSSNPCSMADEPAFRPCLDSSHPHRQCHPTPKLSILSSNISIKPFLFITFL